MNKADGDRRSYRIVPMTRDDAPTVVEFLNEFFYRQGPITGVVKITEDLESLEKLQNYGCKTLQGDCERIGTYPECQKSGLKTLFQKEFYAILQ